MGKYSFLVNNNLLLTIFAAVFTKMSITISDISISPAIPEDLPGVYGLIKDLAIFENEPKEPSISLEQFIQDGTGESPAYEVFVAKDGSLIIGIALYYFGYSTWKGNMLYLDDLVVLESYRGKGLGRKLIDAIIRKGQSAGVNQIRWQVLDWNKDAIAFYNSLPANLDASWINCKLEKDFLDQY